MITANFLKNNFTYIIIAILIAVVCIQRCHNSPAITSHPTVSVNGKKYELLSQKTDTSYKRYDSIVYRPGKDIYHDNPIYVTVPANVDTEAILKDYYSKRVYKDTLHLGDSLGYVATIDTISRNAILSRTWNSHINKVIINNTTIVKELPKNQLYFGGQLGFIKPNTSNIGASLMFKTKQDKMYGLSAGYTSNLDLYAQGTILWKISFRKHK